ARGRGTAAGAAAGSAGLVAGDDEQRPGAAVPVLPDPVPRDGERALARWGLLGEGAEPVFTPGARYPLAGLLLALPALEATGLLEAARQVYGRLKDGYYGLAATLLTLVFLALARAPRSEGATRVPPGALGRFPGLAGAPGFMVVAEPADSLAGELRRLRPQLRQVAGQGRRVTVCFDRGGWSPALFAGITAAGSDLLTWRKGPAPDLPADAFTTITCADDRGREHQYDLAGTTVELGI